MSRRALPLIILLVLLACGLLAFYWWRQRSIPTTLIYNEFTGQFEPVTLDDDLDRPAIRQENLHNNPDGLRNYSVLKGYFQAYDSASQTLQVKSTIAYTQGDVFTLTSLQVPATALASCVPAMFTDRNTGRVIPNKDLTVPVLTGETLTLPFEQPLALATVLSQSTEQTFLFIQLTDPFQEEALNSTYKLVAIGLCE